MDTNLWHGSDMLGMHFIFASCEPLSRFPLVPDLQTLEVNQ